MNLDLAVVESCSPEGCQVKLISDGRVLGCRYSALVLDRVRILPGQMVAVDLQPDTPEVAWRWYRGQAAIAPEGVVVNERERQLHAVPAERLAGVLAAGEEVWVTGMEGVWEIHDRVVDGAPENPDWLRSQILPRIAALLAAAPAA